MLTKPIKHIVLCSLLAILTIVYAEESSSFPDLPSMLPPPGPDPVVVYMAKSELKKEKNRINEMLQKAPSVSDFIDMLSQLQAAESLNVNQTISDDIDNDIFTTVTPADFYKDNFVDSKNMCSTLGVKKLSNECADAEPSQNPYHTVSVASLLQTTQVGVAQEGAIKQLIKNLTAPFVNAVDLSDPKKISEQVAKKVVGRGLLSAPLNSLYEMYNIRRVKDDKHMSVLATMERESSWRLNSDDWLNKLAVSPKEAILREIAHIKAASLWMQYKQYRQMERIEGLLAVLTSKMIVASEAMDAGGSMSAADVQNAVSGSIGGGAPS